VAREAAGSYALSGSPLQVGDSPGATALSPDGGSLYVACYHALAEIQTATLAMRKFVLPPETWVLQTLAVTPDGKRVLATWGDNAVMIFDAASLRLVQTIDFAPGEQDPLGIAITPDASRIITANIATNSLGVISQIQGSAEDRVGRP
jgi:DNA-binding beta-propeller fold protein YncE